MLPYLKGLKKELNSQKQEKYFIDTPQRFWMII